MRNFLIGLIMLLWVILGWLYCKDFNKCCIDGKGVEAVSEVVMPEKTGPILFNWANKTPILGNGWPSMRDSLLALTTGNNILEITGWYCSNLEPKETDSLGFARAAETRKLFSELADDKVILLSKSVTCDSAQLKGKFESVSFAHRMHTENIKEIADKTLIYFPFNSTKKLNSKEVETYLNEVAERVTKSGETVKLVGHTDNIGDDESNQKLGQVRADVVKNYLVSKGVNASKILTSSDGESTPISENDTESGRAKNRRTELQIIK